MDFSSIFSSISFMGPERGVCDEGGSTEVNFWWGGAWLAMEGLCIRLSPLLTFLALN